MMLLLMSEHTFTVTCLPGVRNIISAYETQQINVSEWDKYFNTTNHVFGIQELTDYAFQLLLKLKVNQQE